MTLSSTAAGSIVVTANYGGDGTYSASTSAPISLVVSQGSSALKIVTVTSLTAAASATVTGNTTLTATVTPSSAGTATPTGAVVFYDGATQIGIGSLTAGATAGTYVATASVTLSSATTHTLTAVYSGDALYAGSVSPAVTGTGTPTGTTTSTITLTANTVSGLAGANIVLTASVTGVSSTAAVATGTVSFYAAGATPRLLGTATLGQAGVNFAQAVLSTTLIASGSQSVYAVYSGDKNFVTATSNFLTIGLSDYNLTFVPQSLTLNPGNSGQTTIILGIVNGFSGTVTFGCTPPPNAQITCSFSPTVLTGGGSTTMTVNTVAPRARSSQQASLLTGSRGASVFGGLSLAGLLCFFLPAGRRRRLPAMLLVLIALALGANLGCSDNGGNFFGSASGGTPLGTTLITVNTAGSDGVNTVRHDYTFQVTIQ